MQLLWSTEKKLTEIRFKSLSLAGSSESYILYVFLSEITQEWNSLHMYLKNKTEILLHFAFQLK